MRSAGLLALCLFSATLASALPSYSCSSGNGVVCASDSPPGGLSQAETPQFILLTHDDAITVTSNNAVGAVIKSHSQANGCNVPLTWFVSGGSGTNCAIARRLFENNHEIASHTFSHAQLVPGMINITDEIQKERLWLNQSCNIPLEQITSFRSPYLLHNPEVRQALQALGVTIDSSIVESWPSATSPSSSNRLWPYSTAAGIPQTCQWMAPSSCNSSSEKYSSLWEVPMLQFISSSGIALSTMDPTATSAEALLAQLLEQFSFSYNGNRAPMGIYVHTPWFAAKSFHGQSLSNFIAEVLKKKDVWLVTMQQLRAWMAAPVPASQMTSWLKCNPVDYSTEDRAPCSTVVVQPGMTLFDICATEEVELLDLLAANPGLTSSSSIYVGQRLSLPPWNASCPDTLAGLPPCRNHTVVAGDSLYGLALSMNITVADLLAVNTGLIATSGLTIGQVLRIPPWPVECIYGNFSKTATPAPTPAPSKAIPEEAATACGEQSVELDLALTGFTSDTFAAHLLAFKASLSALLRQPADCITIIRAVDVATTPTGQRRLMSQGMQRRSLLADPQVLVVIQIQTANATLVASYLAGAQQLGSLDMMLGLLGAKLDNISYTALTAEGTPIMTSALAAPPSTAQSPTAAPVTETTTSPVQLPVTSDAAPTSYAASSTESSSNLGAILGGAIGGGVGALLLIALFIFFMRRRRSATAGAGGLRTAYATHNPTFAGATANLSTNAGGKGKDAFELTEVIELQATGTPRSARRRNQTAFN